MKDLFKHTIEPNESLFVAKKYKSLKTGASDSFKSDSDFITGPSMLCS